MGYVLGMAAGSIIAIAILSMLLSLFAYKSLEPIKRAVATVMTAYAIAVLIYGMGSGHFGEALFFYGIGAVVIFFERRRHYEKHWTEEERSEWYETFR